MYSLLLRRIGQKRRVLLWAMLVSAGAAGPSFAHTALSLDIARISGQLRNDPDRVDLLLRRGRLFRFDGNPLASLADLNRAGRLAPDRWDVVFERAMTLGSLNRDSAAERELTRCLALHRSLAVAYAERGKIRIRTGRQAAGIADLCRAIEMKPEIGWYLLRGRLQERPGELDAAAAGYRDGLGKLTGAVLIRLSLVRVDVARGKYDDALGVIDPVLRQAQIKTEWYLRRAEVLAAAGRSEQARGDLQKALDQANGALAKRRTAIHLVSRAKVFAAMHRSEDALADVRQAVRQSPKFREAAELLGELQAEKVAPSTVGAGRPGFRKAARTEARGSVGGFDPFPNFVMRAE